jgi:Sigma-70, region 4
VSCPPLVFLDVYDVMTTEDVETAHRRWLAIFEDRHGADAYDRLIADLRQPCVTFAEIARRLGVSRERVRQWQKLLLPEAPRGHQRQRLCAIYRRRRRLLDDPLFRTFYRHARAFVDRGRIELIKASEGYRTRSVRIDRRIVVLREARMPQGAPSAPSAANEREFLLAGCRETADFLYYRLTPDDYLLLPVREIPAAGTTFVDRPGSPYHTFKNTFGALRAETAGHA